MKYYKFYFNVRNKNIDTSEDHVTHFIYTLAKERIEKNLFRAFN